MTTPQRKGGEEDPPMTLLVDDLWVIGRDIPKFRSAIEKKRAVHLSEQIRNVLDAEKETRSGKPTTNEELASRVDVALKTLWNYKLAKTEANSRVLLALSTVLGVDVQQLTPTTLDWVAGWATYVTDKAINQGESFIFAQYKLEVRIPPKGFFDLEDLFRREIIVSRVVAPLSKLEEPIDVTVEGVREAVLSASWKLDVVLSELLKMKKAHGIRIQYERNRGRYRGLGHGDQGRTV